MTTLPPPPQHLARDGQPAFGRYLGAIPEPILPLPSPFGRFRLKEWHYFSFSGDDAFVALAIVQLGYLATGFVYAVDRRNGIRFAQTEALLPLGRGVTMAPSSIQGASLFRHGQDQTALRFAPDERGWTAAIDVRLEGERLHGEIRCQQGEGLALVHRLASGKPAYTHKDAGMVARADLTWGQRAIRGEGLACSDWTRSLAMHETRWNWASLSHRLPDGRHFGLNLSAHVLDDTQGESEEDAAWLDGKLHVLGGARFVVPERPSEQRWRIESMRQGEFALTFQPLGARRQDVDLGLVVGKFLQPFGEFTGVVQVGEETVQIERGFGVVEDHFARW
jgi:hypothetical protein